MDYARAGYIGTRAAGQAVKARANFARDPGSRPALSIEGRRLLRSSSRREEKGSEAKRSEAAARSSQPDSRTGGGFCARCEFERLHLFTSRCRPPSPASERPAQQPNAAGHLWLAWGCQHNMWRRDRNARAGAWPGRGQQPGSRVARPGGRACESRQRRRAQGRATP